MSSGDSKSISHAASALAAGAFAVTAATLPGGEASAQDSWRIAAAAGWSTAVVSASVPSPQKVHTRRGPLRQTRTSLVPLNAAPFPYEGLMPRTNRPFLETAENGRRFHRNGRGALLWEDQSYADSRVLLHMPQGFDARRPGLIVIYFHGHGAQLETDVYARQQVAEQVTRSGLNAVLIAPQFAVNAADSSAGKLWEPGGLARLIDEAGGHLADLYGDRRAKATFEALPVVLVAYSGGYAPAAWTIRHGGLGERLKGVVLFDALYGEIDAYADWITAERSAFFISTFTSSTRDGNVRLQRTLDERNIPVATTLDGRLRPGGVALLAGAQDSNHRDFLTRAWVDFPLQDLLARLPGYRRS